MRIAVYQPDIAQNLGAIVRICSCFGTALDVVAPCGFPLSSKGLRRVAMDYGANVDIHLHDSWELYCQHRGPGRLILLSTKAAVTTTSFSFLKDDTVLLGRESAGVPADVEDYCNVAVRIPMPGGGRSLNVAVAGAIAVSEALRQIGE